MKFTDLIDRKKGDKNYPKKELIFLGVNPIIEEMSEFARNCYDMLITEENLHITIIHESDTENFNQSLFGYKDKGKIEFEKLELYKKRLIGGGKKKNVKEKVTTTFVDNIIEYSKKTEDGSYRVKSLGDRIHIYQNNLRHNVNLIKIDDVIYYSITTLEIPKLESYIRVSPTENEKLYLQFDNYIKFILDPDAGGKYLSKPGDELIELYDNNSYPRGIYPRKAFYTTDFQRYSIWGFIFNRKGELLLQRRSTTTQDNRALWDKSTGGHVDLMDSSTIITAKRELVEEMFLPEAEYTKYMQAALGDIIDFGEWNINKREECHFIDSFNALDFADWIVFRATDKNDKGEIVPMTVRRKSPRVMHLKTEVPNSKIVKNTETGEHEYITTWFTRFISDVYLFIAPEGYIDNNEQMEKLLKAAEENGAAEAHRLTTIEDLINDVETNPDNYTDDMVYICSEKKWLLIQFSESIKYIFNR